MKDIGLNLKERILEALKSAKAPITEADFLEQIRGRRQDKVKTLRELVVAGDVKRVGGGKRGDPFSYTSIDGIDSTDPTAVETEILASKSKVSEQAEATVPVSNKPSEKAETSPSESNPEAFKTYKLPDGSMRSISKEEFDQIAEAYRLLYVHSLKVESK